MTDNKIIISDDEAICQYGIQQLLTMLVNLICTIILGVLYERLFESILIVALYIPLRSYAGGFHAKTSFRCFVYSLVMMFLLLSVIKFFKLGNTICFIICIMSGIIIFLVSPVPDKNKPLEKIEYKVFKRRSRQILAIEVLLFVVSILTKWNTIAECVSLSLGLVAVMLVMGRKNKGSGFI
ncbi:MAG: accessory gene regulator B family protein [Oscillospiraceae bacterium]|nr:accessory gene regulator B family protein [Oscillospiraceae bacterium]